ncbi:MAG TPA: HlyD family efflux transporter periplasmic adaptor subunit [Thermoanaerobaculia bacterium]|nr:HlyD family efflux transporter periplasmic adaptor subunit [Thermoanaerobaculia bacterium]
MDRARDPSIKRKKQIRRIALGAVGVVVLMAVTFAIYSLEPAAYPVERESVWDDTVKRGEMVRQVRGPGTLVPEEVRWIPARTEGRVEAILTQPGTVVTADTIILELVNPELTQEVQDADLSLTSAQADYENLRAQLESSLLEREAAVSAVASQLEAARLEADANQELSDAGLIPEITLKRSRLTVEQLEKSLGIERQRMVQERAAVQAQLAARRAQVEQSRALSGLRRGQVGSLAVRAGIDGVLQEVPVEVGQQVTAGTILARVARPDTLKAELQIPETQAKDVTIGQPARIDTRNGVVDGRVVRIDPAVQNGYVQVDVDLIGELPKGARPDLSVDGTIQIERLEDVLYMGRPSYGESGSTIQLFKIVGAGDEAVRVDVQLGRTSVNTVEVVGGLDEGDRVILSDPSAWDGHDRLKLK